jgi:F0F1-type ATP synthase membrane subunit c/vacuolar-type H+-ATPase subunit K
MTQVLFASATGAFVNVGSNDFAYKFVGVLSLIWLVFATLGLLSPFKPNADIVVYARNVMLIGALACALLAAVPTRWAPVAAIVSGLLVAATIKVVADWGTFTRTLFGSVFIGFVIVSSKFAITSLRAGERLNALQWMTVAALMVSYFFAIMRDSHTFRLAVLRAMEICYVALSLIFLVSGDLVGALGCTVAALMARNFRQRSPKKIDPESEVVPGALIASPSSQNSIEFRRFVDRRTAVLIGSGLISISVAGASFAVDQHLIGVILIVGGLACFVRGSQIAPKGSRWPALREWWNAQPRHPTVADSAATQTVGTGGNHTSAPPRDRVRRQAARRRKPSKADRRKR